MVRFLCSAAVVVCVACSAVADIPPPPPERGFKRVPYVHSLKLDTDLPGYRFFPFQRLGLGGKETVGEELKLGTDAGVAAPSSSSPSVRTGVVAVPTTVMDGLKTKENLAQLLGRTNKDPLPAGVVVHETRGTTLDLRERDPRTKVEVVITVSRDEKAGVKFTLKEPPAPPAGDGPPAERPQSPLALLFAGLAAALAAVTLGVWYVRRK